MGKPSTGSILESTKKEGVCQNKDLQNRYLQFEIIMPAWRASENIARWTGWGILIPSVIFAAYDLLEHIPAEKVYNQTMDGFIFSLFCLIVAEVFAIGLKLKEEQDLTI